MAIRLNSFVFIHIPKTGGKWVSNMLIKYCPDASYIGDPIYDAHKSPALDLPALAFTRDPATWLHSLWHHRKRKKQNRHGMRFNWQVAHRLERECQSSNFSKFMDDVSNNPGCIFEYYEDFLSSYDEVYLARYENLAEDLVRHLNFFNENFNGDAIMSEASNFINTTKRFPIFKKPNSFRAEQYQDLLLKNHRDYFERLDTFSGTLAPICLK